MSTRVSTVIIIIDIMCESGSFPFELNRLFGHAWVLLQMINSARSRHELKLAHIREQWETKRKRQLEAHEERVAANKSFNIDKRAEVKEQQRAHNEAVAANKEIIAVARAKYEKVFEAEKAEHDAALAKARLEFMDDCDRMVAEHNASQQRALEEWIGLKTMLEARNKEAEEVSIPAPLSMTRATK